MRALVIALPILITFALGWFGHAWMVRRRPVLNKQDARELELRRDLDDRLVDISLSHIESEAFAAIVLDEVRKTEKQVNLREGELA